MFEGLKYALPGRPEQDIYRFSMGGLLKAYTEILTDIEGAGTYEPAAYRIREVWHMRGYNLKTLHKIDRRFKNIKRKINA